MADDDDDWDFDDLEVDDFVEEPPGTQDQAPNALSIYAVVGEDAENDWDTSPHPICRPPVLLGDP